MRLQALKRQNSGSALLVFIVAVSVISLTLVVGLAHQFSVAQNLKLPERQQKYLRTINQQLELAYEARANDPETHPAGVRHADVPGGSDVLSWTTLQPKWGVSAIISNRLSHPDGFFYRRVAIWLPREGDSANPPDVAKFVSTGEFDPCRGSTCPDRAFEIFDSMPDEQRRFDVTRKRMGYLALRAQSYFLTRQLQQPERNVSVNYFRDPVGACVRQARDIGCIDSWTRLESTPIPELLSLSSSDLVSSWGTPIEVINQAPEAQTDDAPFTLVYRTCTDTRNACLRVVATQSL